MADRVIHDADAHLLEPPDLFTEHADPDVRDRIDELTVGFRINDDGTSENEIVEHFRRRHGDPEFRSHDEEQIWLRKNFEATGSFIAEDRPAALDMLGVASQLIFNTFTNKTLQRVEHGEDLDLAYGLARAHNRAVVEFCSVDARLLPTKTASAGKPRGHQACRTAVRPSPARGQTARPEPVLGAWQTAHHVDNRLAGSDRSGPGP